MAGGVRIKKVLNESIGLAQEEDVLHELEKNRDPAHAASAARMVKTKDKILGVPGKTLDWLAVKY